MKRRIIIFSVILTLLLSAVSCSKEIVYRNDLSCSSIAREIIDEAEVAGGYSEYSEEHIAFFFDNTTLHDDFALLYSTEVNNINEVGIFHTPDTEKAEELLEVVERYIKDQQENQKAFISSYAPREVPKLDSAEARRYGTYVIYMILDSDDANDAWEDVENMLKK